MLKTFRGCLAAALLSPIAALAQTPAPAPAPAAPAAAEPAKPPPKWYETVEIHGLVDTYYSVNFDQQQSPPNELRVFDALNGFQLGYTKVWAQLAPTTPFTAGFRLDIGLGQAAAILNGNSTYGLGLSALPPGVNGPSSGIGAVVVQQAYGSLKLPLDIVLDGGKFVTNAGAEVIEAKDNWLYSRSLLFGFAIPFTHTGVRATVPVPGVEGLSVMAGLFNGFDNPPGPVGSSKAGHVALIYSGPSSTSVILNLLYGRPLPGQQDKTLVDVVLARAFGDLSLNVNFDYGDQNSVHYWGIAGMVRYSLFGDKLRISGRGEYLNDDDGTGLIFAGAPNKYYEGTLGLSIPVGSQVELRLEGRHDRMSTAAFTTGKDNQTTLQVAALAWF